MHRDPNDDKPFVCPVTDCGMRFINEDHLNVHSKKHEMSLALNAGAQSSSSPAHHFLDQTPTPTKFLKNCEEISLFQELTQNPFDHAYKKALDNDPPLPGPQTGELNTPTLILTDSLKSSANLAAIAFPSGFDKIKGSEPLKPSPLAKMSSANKILLDLSGKSVLMSQASLKDVAVRNLNFQDLDSVSTISPALVEQVLAVGVAAPHATKIISPAAVPMQADVPQHSRYSLTGLQQHKLAPGTSVTEAANSQPELMKQEAIKKEEITVAEMAGVYADQQQQQQQQQCTMQVLLQLPTGETVPISIPATINKLQCLDGIQQTQILQQHKSPPLQPMPSKTATSSISTTMALKQRLKAQLQNQLSPTTKVADVTMASSNPTLISGSGAATPVSISGHSLVGSTSPIMMVDSPNSEMNLSDSSDYSMDGKQQKMSPETGDSEERRRKFLERNRAAAARCRQKRKHWISNLEKKADELQGTNLRLQSEVKLLRGEVAQLKTLLLAHKDCPVTQQQRSQGQMQHIILTDSSLSSQDLAQVVPTAEVTSESLHLGPAIVTFLQESVICHPDDLDTSAE